MLYHIKKSIIPWIYTLSMAFIAYGLVAWEGLKLWLQITLAVLNLVMYGIVVVITSFKDGEDAMKVLHDNDANRRRIIETGADIPINRTREYKAYKGFITGLVTASPMIILLIVHAIVFFTTNKVAVGGIAVIIYNGYAIFYSFFMDMLNGINAFYLLTFLPLIVSFSGVSYILGARKMQRVYYNIKEQQKELYGE